jgi:hypothetical protein
LKHLGSFSDERIEEELKGSKIQTSCGHRHQAYGWIQDFEIGGAWSENIA